MSTVVSWGSVSMAKTGQLSYPVTATSSGTPRPSSSRATRTPDAIWSEPQSTASTSGTCRSSAVAAARAHRWDHSATPADATWLHSYLASQATLTGTGWNINTEGTPSNLGGYATAGEQDVGGLRTGSSAVITFDVDVPRTGNYDLSVFDGSNSAAADVSGPTNVFARVDGGSPQQLWLPAGYNWVIWNHGDTTVYLTAGRHQISLGTVGADGAATKGDAIVNKIDLQLDDPAVQDSVVYEAEQADLAEATADYRAQGQ
jgi:hypothetical protein